MGYFYHGVSDMTNEETLDYFIEILKSGKLKTRQEVTRGTIDPTKDFNHVCLYRKNNDHDYNKHETFLKSAQSGWIDHCFVFIISPEIEAEKTTSQYSDLADEWRSHGPIPFDKVVGIEIPFDGIEEDRTTYPEYYQGEYQQKLDFILDFAKNSGWRIENSDEKDFCDKLDKSLEESKLL